MTHRLTYSEYHDYDDIQGSTADLQYDDIQRSLTDL